MLASSADRRTTALIRPAALVGAVGLLTYAVLADVHPLALTLVAATIILFSAEAARAALAWRSLLALLILVILFLPIRRYILPGHLPFQLEPYRILVALLAVGWVGCLLVDARIRVRRSGFEGPMLMVILTTFGSVSVNASRTADLNVATEVVKSLTFFISFVVVFYLIVSVVRRWEDLEFLVKVLVGGGAVLAILAVIEANSGYNVFNHLSEILPILGKPEIPYQLSHPTGRLRVYATAESPIALAAVFVMLIPLAIYLAQTSGRRRWWAATILLFAGAVASVSRTGIVMLAVVVLVYLWLQPRNTKRLWVAALPLLLAVHFALPGALGSVKERFFPRGGLVTEQSQGAGSRGSGRLADLGPGLSEFSRRPLLGEGYGTRVTDLPKPNAPILDNEWLGTLLKTGVAGVLGWVWLFARFIRRLSRQAKGDSSALGQLMTALAASVLALAVGWYFFDALSFTQVTLLLFILLALGNLALSINRPAAPVRPDS